MPSKIFRIFILLFSVAGFLTSCSYFFDEKTKDTEVSYQKTVGQCIGDANNSMKGYFDASLAHEVSEAELEEFSLCYQNSIESLVTNTKSGRVESDDYSAENIELLIKKLHPGKALDIERIRGYIMLKAFVIGGNSETVSKKELLVIKKLLPVVARGLKSLLPYRDILLRSADLNRSREDFRRFKLAFSQFEIELNNILKAVQSYQGNGRQKVDLTKVAHFLFSEIYEDSLSEKMKMIPLLIAFKNFSVDEDSEFLNRRNLSAFLHQARMTFEVLSHFEYFLKEDKERPLFGNLGHLVSFVTRIPVLLANAQIFQTVALDSLGDIFKLSEKIFAESLSQRKNKTLKIDRIKDILLGLETAEIMNGPLRAETLGFFLANFSKKWADPGSQVVSDLNFSKLQYLLKNFWDLVEPAENFERSLQGALERRNFNA